jgi:uncharacterized membrane protein
MIESEHDAVAGTFRFVLKPNASMSPRQVRGLIAVLAVAMGSIGLFFANMGAWLVLPFSGAEWLLLAVCFKLVLARSAVREVITITAHAVLVESGHGRAENTQRIQRAWVNVDCVRSRIAGHPSRLYLRRHGKSLEIGRFLVEPERQGLALELRRILTNFEY